MLTYHDYNDRMEILQSNPLSSFIIAQLRNKIKGAVNRMNPPGFDFQLANLYEFATIIITKDEDLFDWSVALSSLIFYDENYEFDEHIGLNIRFDVYRVLYFVLRHYQSGLPNIQIELEQKIYSGYSKITHNGAINIDFENLINMLTNITKTTIFEKTQHSLFVEKWKVHIIFETYKCCRKLFANMNVWDLHNLMVKLLF
jgi:hypothetical protein